MTCIQQLIDIHLMWLPVCTEKRFVRESIIFEKNETPLIVGTTFGSKQPRVQLTTSIRYECIARTHDILRFASCFVAA